MSNYHLYVLNMFIKALSTDDYSRKREVLSVKITDSIIVIHDHQRYCCLYFHYCYS
jgi:ArsR family metal-binding transcriptional regulator